MVVVTWLSLGVVYSVHTVLSSRAESQCLSLLGQAAAHAEIAYVRSGTESFPDLVEQISQGKPPGLQRHRGHRWRLPGSARSSAGRCRADHARRTAPELGRSDAVQYLDDHGQRSSSFVCRCTSTRANRRPGDRHASARILEYRPRRGRSIATCHPGTANAGDLWRCCWAGFPYRWVASRPNSAIWLRSQLPARSPVRSCPRDRPSTLAGTDWWTNCGTRAKHPAGSRLPSGSPPPFRVAGRKSRSKYCRTCRKDSPLPTSTAEITFANRAIAALLGETGQDTTGSALYDYLSGSVDNPDALLELSGSNPDRTARAEVTRSHGDRRRVIRIERQPLQHGGKATSGRSATSPSRNSPRRCTPNSSTRPRTTPHADGQHQGLRGNARRWTNSTSKSRRNSATRSTPKPRGSPGS